MSIEILVTKWNWNAVKNGGMDRLLILTKEGAKNIYGKDWRMFVTELRIEEVVNKNCLNGKDRELNGLF